MKEIVRRVRISKTCDYNASIFLRGTAPDQLSVLFFTPRPVTLLKTPKGTGEYKQPKCMIRAVQSLSGNE
jgi:hypothetical protein